MRHVLALITLALASCGSPANSYYMLTAAGESPFSKGVGIGLGPISLAGHLDRPNLVVQETDHRLGIADAHRWAGPLETNIAHVTAANLGRELHTGYVLTYPWTSDAGLSYQIALDIHHLEGTANGDALLDATWRVYSLPERGIRAVRSWYATEPLKRDGYDELVAEESKLLARLAKEIAKSIRQE